MKRLLLTLVLFTIGLCAYAQPVLTEESHGLRPGPQNHMILTECADPGADGPGVVWDFSNLVPKGPFMGDFISPNLAKAELDFQGANSLQVEGQLEAFLHSSQKSLEVLGARIAGQLVEKYNLPLLKMRYPFTYGNFYMSSVSGEQTYNSGHKLSIWVECEVAGDAYGKLILPGTTLENTLRVHWTYSRKYGSEDAPVHKTHIYRWYAESYRFPVLVLILDEASDGTLRCVRAAYHPLVELEALADAQNSDKEEIDGAKVVEVINHVIVRPNPFNQQLSIDYTLSKSARVTFTLYNAQGQLVRTLAQVQQPSGQHTQTFLKEVQSLVNGMYILRVEAAGKVLSRTLLKVR